MELKIALLLVFTLFFSLNAFAVVQNIVITPADCPQTCAGLGGNVCGLEQTCPGQWLCVVDTGRCCDVACTTEDTTPPLRSNAQPTGTLSSGTTSTTIGLETTNENATCKYDTQSGTAYSLMPFTFSTTGGTVHSSTVTGLTDATSYYYFVRCQDTAGNANPDDFVINFSVSSPQATCDDLDGDGYGSPASTACTHPGLDCNDSDATVNPGVNETAYNGKDDDCNPNTPDDDLDGDGFCVNPSSPLAAPGMQFVSSLACDPRPDCDDTKDFVNPGMAEIPYNALDDDCDASTPDDDLDYDSYPLAQDCDDTNADIFPGVTRSCGTDVGICTVGTQTCGGDSFWSSCTGIPPESIEQCNNLDDDCDGEVDELFDSDGDGYIDEACGGANGDCDDQDVQVYPGATEVCNNKDDSCDGTVDEGFDLDGDNYSSCALPVPDCNNLDPLIYPGAPETCGDGIDQDCSGEDLVCVECDTVGATEACTAPDTCAGTRTCGTDLFWGACEKTDLCCGVSCDDFDSCTNDSCDSLTGSCVFDKPDLCCGVSCDDSDSCTTDSCNALTGSCSFTPIPGCGDGGGGDEPKKNFSVSVQETICINKDFVLAVQDKETGNLLSQVRVNYSSPTGPMSATKDTDRYGKVSFIALEGFTTLVFNRPGYNVLNMIVNPVKCLVPDSCGNAVCESESGENEFNCAQDCKGQTPSPTDKFLVIEVAEEVTDREAFALTVKDQDGNPVRDAKVAYGILVEFTDGKGKATLTAYKGYTEITAEKEGYTRAVASIKIKRAGPSALPADPLVLVAVTLMIIITVVVLIFKFGVLKEASP